MPKRSLRALTLLCVSLASATASADGLAPLDRFWLAAGVYASDNDLDVRLDGSDVVAGSDVDFQRDFGFSEKESANTFDAGFTLANRHQFGLSGHRYSSQASRVLQQGFDVDDQDFVVDATFNGDLELRIVSAGYTYFPHSTETSAFGIGLGGVQYAIDMQLAAAGEVSDGQGGLTPIQARVDKTESAWAPMLRAQYSQMLGQQWRWSVELAGVKKNSGSVQGNAVDARIGLDYFPWRQLGFSLRYSYNDVDLDYAKDSYRGAFRLRNRGPALLAVLRF